MPARKRRSRKEILGIYRACRKAYGQVPSRDTLLKMGGLRHREVYYYWPKYRALVREAGDEPTPLAGKLPEEFLFREFARACVHAGRVVSREELQNLQRKLRVRTSAIRWRYNGSMPAFRSRFRQWLEEEAPPEYQPILEFDGWNPVNPFRKRSSSKTDKDSGKRIDRPQATSGKNGMEQPAARYDLRPMLPAGLQYLDVLARGERPPFGADEPAISTAFEKRTADAFRCLGMEVISLGPGCGRSPDAVALAPRQRFAIILDAKVRSQGYVLKTDDRKFLEYACNKGTELRAQGFDNIYFVVVGPSFKEGDLVRLTESLTDSPVRNVNLITASALMSLVEDSVRERDRFSLRDLERRLFANRIWQ